MALMLDKPRHVRLTSNLSATPAIGAAGTTVTGSASANTKGSWAELVASTPYDVFGITLIILNDSTPATVRWALYDIGVGGSGSEQVIVSNFLNTGSTSTVAAGTTSYFLPIFIPAGTRVAARKQSNLTSSGSSVLVFLHQTSPVPAYTRCEGVGANTATSGGAAVVCGTGAGVEGSWTSVGSTTSREYSCLLPILGPGNDTTVSAAAMHMEIGYSSTAIGEYYFANNSNEATTVNLPEVPIHVTIPSGTQLQARLESSAATADTDNHVVLLGFW